MRRNWIAIWRPVNGHTGRTIDRKAGLKTRLYVIVKTALN